MKKFNFLKLIWMLGIYIILGVILYLVITYKVVWENKDLNTYLYFYKCDNMLCTTTTNQYDYYSKILCEDDICPYITKIFNDNVILSNNDASFIYNYKEGNIVSNTYNNYTYLNDQIFVISDESNMYGIFNLEEQKVLVEPKYESILDYKDNLIAYKANGFYGIENADSSINITPEYEDICLVDDSVFIGRIDNKYQPYLYQSPSESLDKTYNYAYSYNGYIVTLSNNKLDILNSDLESVLLMKIDTTYTYEIEQERASLNLSHDNNNIYFTINNDGNKTNYIFDTTNGKLSN